MMLVYVMFFVVVFFLCVLLLLFFTNLSLHQTPKIFLLSSKKNTYIKQFLWQRMEKYLVLILDILVLKLLFCTRVC